MGLPKPSPETLDAIIAAAHERGKRVAVHVTQSVYMAQAVAAGADIIAHVPYDPAPPELLEAMARKGVLLTPTFTVFRNYGAPVDICRRNLEGFVRAGRNWA